MGGPRVIPMRAVLLTIAWVACAPSAAFAADAAIKDVLPFSACAEGWNLDGKVTLFDKETLFDRIDGEAEAYFPYGFDALAYARYADGRNPRIAVDADVYRMGSLLDAFGIYAVYRRKDSIDANIGAEGTISPSQMIFYQGRYFVRLQATGTSSPGEHILLACGRSISRLLPPNASRPGELEAFAISPVVPKSERYVAQSLLGYDFFRRGLIADAVLDNDRGQLFLVPEDSGDSARKAMDRYRSYLEASGKEVGLAGSPGRISLASVDPLYGNVFVAQAGRFLVGAVRFRNPSIAKRLVEKLREGVRGD